MVVSPYLIEYFFIEIVNNQKNFTHDNRGRYRELLPVDHEPTIGVNVGFTPLIKAEGLAKALGVKELYLKNDAVNYPTLSFKDRVVSVALSKAKEFGFRTVACASPGNLANSVAALASAGGFKR